MSASLPTGLRFRDRRQPPMRPAEQVCADYFLGLFGGALALVGAIYAYDGLVLAKHVTTA